METMPAAAWFATAAVAWVTAVGAGLLAMARSSQGRPAAWGLVAVACLLCVVFGLCMQMGMAGHL